MGIHAPRRPTRHPVPERRLWLPLVVVLLLILGGCGLGWARAQEATEDAWVISQEAAALVPPPTATSEPEPTRYAPSGRGARPAVARWAELVSRYDWDADQALAVISCESAGDPGAVNRWSGAAGLFQLLSWGWLAERLFGTRDVLDPAVNAGVAYHLWRDSGGTFRWHWSASWGCWL